MQKQGPTATRILIALGFAISCFGLALFLWIAFGGPVPLKESSGLRFDHACHLGGDKVQQVKDGEPGWLCAKQDGFLPARSYPPRALAEAPSTGELARIEIDAVMAAGFKRNSKPSVPASTSTRSLLS